MTSSRRLDCSGASAAEFALVLPLLVVLLFSIIDGGRYIWEVNRAEKATQAGARVAIVTDVLDSGLASHSYLGDTTGGTPLTQGDLIPAAALTGLVCDENGCACEAGGTCPPVGTFDTASFNNIVQRMQFMKPDIEASNVVVTYRGSGLGYAGDPNGMDISPLVTVELIGMQFQPLVAFGAAAITLPTFRTTLTAEDSEGSQSN